MTDVTPCAVLKTGRVLEIPDADGEAHDYRLSRAPAALDEWACTIERLDGGGGSPYRVAVTVSGSWRCSCADAKYRARKLSRLCKHAAAVAPLYQAIKELS